MGNAEKEMGPPKIWCPVSENFKYTTICEKCNKKNGCEVFKEFIQPRLI
jgi:hypothetical protein